MTARKASLRVAHQGKCPNAGQSRLESVDRACKCLPSYFTFHRGPDGKAIKGERIKTLSVAKSALNLLQVEIDQGRTGQARPKVVTFETWADTFETITEGRVRRGELKGRTLTAYRETLTLARLAFGDVPLKEIGHAELRDFYDMFEKLSPASRLRHLRQLSAAMSAAVDEQILLVNPVPVFAKKLKLRAPKRGKAPFEDGELERLWTALAAVETVYLYSARLAVETGARLGEIVGLDWTGVDLTRGRITILSTWDSDAGELVTPKSGETRVVYLTKEARGLLEEWVGVVGVHESGPVFADPYGEGRLSVRLVQRRFAAAMTAAGIPKLHPDLQLPRSFHSLRYTTSNVMQRRGYHPRLIEQTLGHGSLELTYGVYGGWTPSQLAAEATRTSE